MAYIIGQYNHNNASSDDASFITPITSGRVARKSNSSDIGVTGGSLSPFEDECITDLNLVNSEYYYFRGQIKRMTAPQVFVIKLVNYEGSSTDPEQFIKQITVQGGDREEWVSVELIFHPVILKYFLNFQLTFHYFCEQNSIETELKKIRFKIEHELEKLQVEGI